MRKKNCLKRSLHAFILSGLLPKQQILGLHHPSGVQSSVRGSAGVQLVVTAEASSQLPVCRYQRRRVEQDSSSISHSSHGEAPSSAGEERPGERVHGRVPGNVCLAGE